VVAVSASVATDNRVNFLKKHGIPITVGLPFFDFMIGTILMSFGQNTAYEAKLNGICGRFLLEKECK